MTYERDTPEPDVDENGDCKVCENERPHCSCIRCEFCSAVENDENWRVCGGCMDTFQKYWDAEQAKSHGLNAPARANAEGASDEGVTPDVAVGGSLSGTGSPLDTLRSVLVGIHNRAAGRGHTYYHRKATAALALLDAIEKK